ncbi:MAG: hypothetical protein KAI70_01885, partial [Candidatus Omnitrophica bacterium]|nr:hypothetical protein [Candidatus Omnitrophota bacterium]
MKKKVLIFYISKHSGHFHAAKALKKGFLEIDADIEVRIVNALEYAKPILSKIINKAYIQVIKKKPEIWGSIYDDPDVLKKTAKARRTLNRISLPKIKELLDEFSPDIIFCTQAFPCGLVVDY